MIKITLVLVLLASNVLWYENTKMLQLTLPDQNVYQITQTDLGEAEVYCLNGADATIRPVPEFGHIVVSCGK